MFVVDLILNVKVVGMKKGWMYRLRCAFFGLSPEYKLHLHKSIFELGYFSKGAINIEIAYKLPIHLRKYYYSLLVDLKEKETPKENTSKNKRNS